VLTFELTAGSQQACKSSGSVAAHCRNRTPQREVSAAVCRRKPLRNFPLMVSSTVPSANFA